MKLSTKGRYGLRTMLDLAVNSNGGQVSLSSIAERQDVSESYLEQVFSILRKAGLVKSIKGAQGGYVLTDEPSRITVGDVLRALEGELDIMSVSSDLKSTESMNAEKCLADNVWNKINESVNELVDSITLEDLVEEYQKLNGESALMYYI